MTTVVTGCGGQLGSELCRQLGQAAVGLDLPNFDLTNRDRVVEILTAIRPRAVINTAAFTQVDRAEEEGALCRAVNATGVAHLVEACRKLDCTLVQISTDYVFGGDTGRRFPYRETDAPSPQGVYARSKLEGEQETARWAKHLVVRTCGLYGSRGPSAGGSFVETMLELSGRQKRVRVVSDQHCTPSYVPHVARAVRFLLDTDGHGTYHVVNSGETTWYDLAVEIFRQATLETEVEPITTSDYGARAPRPAYSVLDAGKYDALLGAPAMPPWQDALAEYLATR
ncbi:MAG: dTDP-4-dehydrorhamnose reductase [Planctomycetes bacterium]|nr:dTDP-4-dehydrorhamnose reductase [Planctomycetota bacterium]